MQRTFDCLQVRAVPLPMPRGLRSCGWALSMSSYILVSKYAEVLLWVGLACCLQ